MLWQSHLIILKMLSVNEKHGRGARFVINAEQSSIFHCAKRSFVSFIELENPPSEPSRLHAGADTRAHATKIRIRFFNRKMRCGICSCSYHSGARSENSFPEDSHTFSEDVLNY